MSHVTLSVPCAISLYACPCHHLLPVFLWRVTYINVKQFVINMTDVSGNIFVKSNNVFFLSEYLWNFAAFSNSWSSLTQFVKNMPRMLQVT